MGRLALLLIEANGGFGVELGAHNRCAALLPARRLPGGPWMAGTSPTKTRK
jgi:hypothetical protein